MFEGNSIRSLKNFKFIVSFWRLKLPAFLWAILFEVAVLIYSKCMEYWSHLDIKAILICNVNGINARTLHTLIFHTIWESMKKLLFKGCAISLRISLLPLETVSTFASFYAFAVRDDFDANVCHTTIGIFSLLSGSPPLPHLSASC